MFGESYVPDLGDFDMGGTPQNPEAANYAGEREFGIRTEDNYEYVCRPSYKFNTTEEMISSGVFQKQLSMALAHKDKQIEALRVEIHKLLDEAYEQGARDMDSGCYYS